MEIQALKADLLTEITELKNDVDFPEEVNEVIADMAGLFN
jgi:hypothetical protein